MAPILKMASQCVKSVMLRNNIKTLPMRSARTPLLAFNHHRFQGPISTSLRHTRLYRTLKAPPDGCDYTLFDCDYDLEIAGKISYEASVLVNGDLDLLHPKDEKQAAKILDAGLFRQLLQRFRDRDNREWVVYLGALAMGVGAKIGKEDMKVLRYMVGCIKMYDAAREQMRDALKRYNAAGGYPWIFSCMGPIVQQWQGGVRGE